MFEFRAFVLAVVVTTCASFPTPEDKSSKSTLQTQTINFSDHLLVRCHSHQSICDAVCGRLTSFNDGISSVGIQIPFLDNMVKSVVQGMCPPTAETEDKVEEAQESSSQQPETPVSASNPEPEVAPLPQVENSSSVPQASSVEEETSNSSSEEITNNDTI